MIDTLIGALRLSLNKCNKVDHPVDYIYEINQVLNRYKSNLFTMIPDKSEHIYDPKEFIQLRICMSWKTAPTFSNGMVIKERSPVMLHINGFIPELGLRKNKERTFIRAVDISDIIDLDKIANIKTDYHLGSLEGISEAKTIEEHLGTMGTTCIFYGRDATMGGVQDFTVQIAGQVYYSIDQDPRFSPGVKTIDPKLEARRAKAKKAGIKSGEARKLKPVSALLLGIPL
jgi:hypothetical protein